MLLLNMQNLFTPVEVIRNIHNTYPPEALLRFEQELYGITQPRVLSLADERKRLLAWFRRLAPLERRQAATLDSPEMAALVGRLYEDWFTAQQPTKYRLSLREGKFLAAPERSYRDHRHLEKQLLEHVLLVSRSQLYEAFTLSDVILREPQRLFDLVDELQGGVVDYLGDFHPHQLETGRVNVQIQAQNESKLLAVWVGTLVMKQIALHAHRGTQKIDSACAQHHNQEREYSTLWGQCNEEQKFKLLESAFQKSERDIVIEYSRSVEVVFEWLPRIYLEDKGQAVLERWVKCPPKELLNQLTYVPLRVAFSLSSMYRMEIILQIEGFLSQRKAPKLKKKNKKKRKKEQPFLHKAQSAQQVKPENMQFRSGLQQEKHFPSNENSVIKFVEFKETNKVACKSQPNFQHLLGEKDSTLQFKQETTDSVGVKEHLEQKIEMGGDDKEELSTVDDRKQKEKTENKDKKLLNCLENLYKKVKQENRDRCRKIILNRLIHVLGKYGLSCKAYGSFANQLSLPDSDLDISVDSTVLGFFSFEYLTSRNQVILALQYICSILKPYPWAGNFTLLDTAKVPLLTFTADSSLYFEIGPEERSKLKLNNKKIDPGRGLVQVDLTVQPFANTPELPHCGLQSSESLRGWLNVFPLLQKAIILIKGLLRKAGLHKTFEGGIGSYTIALLLIAFFRSQEEQPSSILHAITLFSSFLHTLADQKWLLDPQGEIPVIKERQSQGPVMKHPYDGHNMLAKCLRFSAALQTIEEWETLTDDI